MSRRPWRARLRLSVAAAAFLAAAGISTGAGAPPDEPLLPFSTTIGRHGGHEGRCVAVAPDGTLWIAEVVPPGAAFPDAELPQQVTGEDTDMVVLHLDPVTHAVLSTARMTGQWRDAPHAIVVDPAGDAFVAGESSRYGSGVGIFVTRLFHDGSGFVWTRRIGGPDDDNRLAGMCLGEDGDPVIAGTTHGLNFPLVGGLPQIPGTRPGAFVSRLDRNGAGFVFSTFLGGPGPDWVRSVCISPTGNIVVLGTTTSVGFFTTSARIVGEAAPGPKGVEGFLAEIDPSGSSLVRAAGLGAADPLQVVASQGALVVSAYAKGGMPFPVPHEPAESERFGTLLRIDAESWQATGGTYLPGSSTDYLASIAPGADGTVWVSGRTGGADLPVPGAIRPLRASPQDAWVGAFDTTDFTQLFGTYLGGSKDDSARGVAVAPDGGAWVVGSTSSTDFPVAGPIAPPFSPLRFSDTAAFVAHVLRGDAAARPVAILDPSATALGGHAIRVAWTPGDAAATSFAIDRSELSPLTVGWTRVAVVPSAAHEWTDTSVRVDRTYRYAVQAVNAAGGSPPSVPVLATTPQTVAITIRKADIVYEWARPRGPLRAGDLLRVRATLLPADSAAPRLDLAANGLSLTTGDVDQPYEVLAVPPGRRGWRTAKNGVQRLRAGAARIVYDPATGALDLRYSTRAGNRLDAVTADVVPTTFRLEVGGEACSTTLAWRAVERKGPRGKLLAGVRVP